MKIPIGQYVITSDSLCFAINEKKKVQKGKNAGNEYLTPILYYGTIESCLEGLLQLKIRKSDATSLEELIAEIGEIRKFIREQFRKARGRK